MGLSLPGSLRRRVLDASLRRRVPDVPVPPVSPAGPAECFHRQVQQLHRTLALVPPTAWDRPAPPYPWSVHGLVGHLLGVESYLGGVLGLWPFEVVGPEEDHLGVTLPCVAETDGVEPGTTVARWAARAELVGIHLRRLLGEDPTRRIDFHGISVSVGSLLVARAFELWTHGEDIRRAIGEPLPTPPAGELRAMADLSMRLLATATPVVAPHQAERPARVVLTGPGGGVWRLGPVEAPPDVLIVADVVEWCRMAARRREPEVLDVLVDGDGQLARDLFAAVQLVVA